MKYKKFIFLSILIFVSCSSRDNGELGVDGDWINKEDYVSINDSIVSVDNVSHRVDFFKWRGDTIVTDDYKMCIRKMSQDSAIAVLIGRDSLYKEYRLKSLKDVSELKVDKIVFSSLGCYGECPVFNFEIDRSGKVFFQGIDFTGNLGNYETMESNSVFELLQDKVKKVNLDSLDTLYSIHGADALSVAIDIFANGRKYSTNVYGNYNEPRELRMLVDYLLSAHRFIRWRRTGEQHIYSTVRPRTDK